MPKTRTIPNASRLFRKKKLRRRASTTTAGNLRRAKRGRALQMMRASETRPMQMRLPRARGSFCPATRQGATNLQRTSAATLLSWQKARSCRPYASRMQQKATCRWKSSCATRGMRSTSRRAASRWGARTPQVTRTRSASCACTRRGTRRAYASPLMPTARGARPSRSTSPFRSISTCSAFLPSRLSPCASLPCALPLPCAAFPRARACISRSARRRASSSWPMPGCAAPT